MAGETYDYAIEHVHRTEMRTALKFVQLRFICFKCNGISVGIWKRSFIWIVCLSDLHSSPIPLWKVFVVQVKLGLLPRLAAAVHKHHQPINSTWRCVQHLKSSLKAAVICTPLAHCSWRKSWRKGKSFSSNVNVFASTFTKKKNLK